MICNGVALVNVFRSLLHARAFGFQIQVKGIVSLFEPGEKKRKKASKKGRRERKQQSKGQL